MKRGFTLIELIAVIVILAIIALITTASVMGLFNKTKSSLYETQVEIVESAAKKWAIANNGFLPTDGSEYALQLSKLVTDGYLDDGDIVDPRTEKEMNGYVNIIYDNSINQYKIEFINLSNAGLTKEYVLNNVSLVTEGAGLYDDKNKTGRYYFRGKNPNNYIKFNNEIWRVISFEADGRIKIIRNESISNMPFDEVSNDWDNSSLKDYLNNDYYQSIDDKYKSLIDGDIELISFDDYLKSNSNRLCIKEQSYFKNNELCLNSSYLNKVINNKNNIAWTKTKDSVGIYHFGNIYFGDNEPFFNDYGVVPTLYLKNNIELVGKGTINNTYKINL